MEDTHALELRRLLQGERHFGHLHYRGFDLYLGETNLAARFEEDPDTPCFVYSESAIRHNVKRLRQALEHAGLRQVELFYALKANRFLPLLMVLMAAGIVGLDVSSPAELELALSLGFAAANISFTSSFLSHFDLLQAYRHAGVMLNIDSLSALGLLWDFENPGIMSLGLRLNLGRGAGYRRASHLFNYGSGNGSHLNGQARSKEDGPQRGGTENPPISKLGLHEDQFDEALGELKGMDLKLGGLHCHLGHNFLSHGDLLDVESAYRRLVPFADRWLELHDPQRLSYVNLGGGLGIPMSLGDEGLDLGAWCAIIAELVTGDLAHAMSQSGRVIIEPGNYLVGDAGVLLCQVTAVEPRGSSRLGCCVVALDVGYNIMPIAKVHKLPSVVLPLKSRHSPGDPGLSNVLVCGNLNEASDVFGYYPWFPSVELGDIVVFANAGAYASSVTSVHSARGFASERMV